jgi:hypothetical protein
LESKPPPARCGSWCATGRAGGPKLKELRRSAEFPLAASSNCSSAAEMRFTSQAAASACSSNCVSTEASTISIPAFWCSLRFAATGRTRTPFAPEEIGVRRCGTERYAVVDIDAIASVLTCGVNFRVCENRRHFRGLGEHAAVSGPQFPRFQV